MARREQGFGVFELAVLIVGVVILGVVGVLAHNNFMAAKPPSESGPAKQDDHAVMEHSPKVPAINSTTDLDKAVAALDDPTFNDDGMDKIEAEAVAF